MTDQDSNQDADQTADTLGGSDFDRDDDLRGMLVAIDPASSLPPADPTGVARLLEDLMNDDITTAFPVAPRRRSPLTWVAAAAAAVLVVGFGAVALGHQGKATPVAAPVPHVVAPATGTLTLSQSTIDTRCTRVPNPTLLAQQDVAFRGTVTSIKGGYVYLRPATFYAGKAVETVKVKTPISLVSAETLTFQVGQTYLVSATDGVVSACGYSAKVSSGLTDLYHQAFS